MNLERIDRYVSRTLSFHLENNVCADLIQIPKRYMSHGNTISR